MDYLTLITTNHRGNKLITRKADGATKKDAGIPISIAQAVTVHVPDAEAMLGLLKYVSEDENRVLAQGFFPGSEPTDGQRMGQPFLILSEKEMIKLLGTDDPEQLLGWQINDEIQRCIMRKKVNMMPSTWIQFDRDIVEGMPPNLAEMSEEEWLVAMGEMVPGFSEVTLLRMASATGRVLNYGNPLPASGSRYWVQVTDAEDTGRFGTTLLMWSFLHPYGFMRPKYSKKTGKVVAKVPWSIFDPTTFSHERLVYDGKPTVHGEGLTVVDADIHIVRDAERLDTRRLVQPTQRELEKITEATGIRPVSVPEKGVDAAGKPASYKRLAMVDDKHLTLDTEIETEIGSMTVMEFWRSDHKRLRCQTAFRDSNSENGILARRHDGVPFHFDNGARIRYDLKRDAAFNETQLELVIQRLGDMATAEIRNCWTQEACCLSDDSYRDKLRRWVHGRTQDGLLPLKKDLEAAITKQKREQAIHARAAQADISGLVPVKYDASELISVLADVENAVLSSNSMGDQILSYAGSLVHVTKAVPVHVRQVQKLNAQGEAYPAVHMIDRYGRHSFRLRVMESCQFSMDTNRGSKEIAAPQDLISPMLEVTHKKAPPLTGLLDHPSMHADGTVISDHGYDPATGIFSCVPRSLVPILPDKISREQIAASMKWLRKELLAEFRFAEDVSESVALAAFLTAVVRIFINDDKGCPGFCTAAPVQGTGKTALFQLLFWIVYGRPAAATSWTNDDTEMGKHLLAILLEGHPGVLFDNLPEGGEIRGNELAKAMTSPSYSNRLLGENRSATAPTQVLWAFTGNNITPTGDFNTRILVSHMDAQVEHPDRRTFARDLAEWAEAHRVEFFQHALTVLVGYQQAVANKSNGTALVDGMPTRFTLWDRMVREAMLYAGCTDPALSFTENASEDPELEGRYNLLMAWHSMVGDEWIVLADLQHVANTPFLQNGPETAGDFKEALSDIFPSRSGIVNTKQLGKFLRKLINRRMNGLVLKQKKVEGSKKSAMWRVEKASSPEESAPVGAEHSDADLLSD